MIPNPIPEPRINHNTDFFPRSIRVLSVAAMCLLMLAGCSRGPAGSGVDKEKQHITHVAELAKDYETATKKKAASINDVKNWAVKEGKGTESDFVSPRDQQEYGFASGMTGLLIYEQTGKNNKVFLFSTGTVREVSPGEVSRMKGLESMRRGMGAGGGRP